MFTGDLAIIFQWWIVLLLFSVTALPLTCSVFCKFEDYGYSLSRIFAFVSVPYILFLLSTLHILKFTRLSVVISLIIFIAIECLIIHIKNNRTINDSQFNLLSVLRNRRIIIIFIFEEIAFLALLVFWSYLRGLHPELNTTEKYMDLGFINGILNSEYMPANDIWASGESINYYYFGSFIVACLTKLSGLTAEYSYNLMMATLFAATFTAVFSLVFGLLRSVKSNNVGSSVFGGALASIMACFSGNLHYLIYGLIIPKLIAKGSFVNAEFLGVDDLSSYSYYFPNSTRFIGYQPVVQGDRTITEFPLYSYVLSDLHAHVINLMAVIFFLAVAFVYMQRETKRPSKYVNPLILLMGFLIGIFCMSNFWDYPIYFIVSIFFLGYVSWKKYGISLRGLADCLMQLAVVFAVQYLIALPLTIGFDKMYIGIALAQNHSKIYQLLVLWGVPLIICIVFLLWIAKNYNKSSDLSGNKTIIMQNADKNYEFSIEIADIFVIILIICAIGLIFGTEIVYVRDIYEENAPRSNTMFKLNYQAFVLFGIAVGYAVARMSSTYRDKKKKIAYTTIMLALCSTTVIYAPVAISQWYGGREYSGLNGIGFVQDTEAIDWIRENTDEDAVILEAYGDSYSENCYVSVTTGRPTVIGWRVHEWLWRNGYDFVAERTDDVDAIYAGTSEEQLLELIDKYNIDYIYVGQLEKTKYGDSLNTALHENIAKVVYNNKDTLIYKIIKL